MLSSAICGTIAAIGNDIVVGQAMSRMGLDPVFDRERCAIGDFPQLGCPLVALDMRIAAGVELDHRRTEPARGVDLALGWLDEQAYADSSPCRAVRLQGPS